ncbi:MAG: trp operon repressor [Spirochaetaceae bacterium]|jgi:TrpR family trp operon transcriptional repressor|nr:trp operon repressor [Spirochaetaceae bacterium]
MKNALPDAGKNIDELSSALAREQDAECIKEFLHSLWTPAEIADIAARWALVKALRKKTPQRIIAKNLGLSLCKITRGSRELKKPNSPFVRMLKLIDPKEGSTDAAIKTI